MKQMAVFLSGVSATLTGAFLRTCNSGMEMDLASAWCGNAPLGASSAASHAHCAGCLIAFTGLVIMGLTTASLLIRRNLASAVVRVRP